MSQRVTVSALLVLATPNKAERSHERSATGHHCVARESEVTVAERMTAACVVVEGGGGEDEVRVEKGRHCGSR